MGAGVPTPCSAKRANASTSPSTPARIIIAPMPRVSSRPRNGGWSCQPVIDHGTSPASVHGATTKKTAEPRTAMVRCTAVPDTRRCEVMLGLRALCAVVGPCPNERAELLLRAGHRCADRSRLPTPPDELVLRHVVDDVRERFAAVSLRVLDLLADLAE